MRLISSAFFLVGMTGFEPATSWSQTRRATNCATSRKYKIVNLTGFGLAAARLPRELIELTYYNKIFRKSQ